MDEDDFTNVFYLHNNDTLKQHYRPFSASLKNAFIDRQHYDRFSQSVTYSFADHEHDDEPFTSIVDGRYYEIGDLNGWNIICSKQNIQVRICDNTKTAEQCINNPDSIYTCVQVMMETSELEHYLMIYMENSEDGIAIPESELQNKRIIINIIDSSYVTQVIDSSGGTLIYPIQVNKTYHAANLELFANTSDTLPYRFQQCVERKPLSIYKDATTGNTIFAEVDDLPSGFDSYTDAQITNYLTSLTEAKRKALVSICVKYLHIITKERITIPTVIKFPAEEIEDTEYMLSWFGSSVETESGIPSASQHLVLPFISAPKGYERLGEYLQSTGVRMILNKGDGTGKIMVDVNKTYLASMITRIQEKFGYYVQSMYITPYSAASEFMGIGTNRVYDETETNYIDVYCVTFWSYPFGDISKVKAKVKIVYTEGEINAAYNAYQSAVRTGLGDSVELYQKWNKMKKANYETYSKDSNIYVNSLSPVSNGCCVFVGESPVFVSYGTSNISSNNQFWVSEQLSKSVYENAGRFKAGNFEEAPKILFEGVTNQDGTVSITTTNIDYLYPFILYGREEFKVADFNLVEKHNLSDNERYEPIMDFEPYTIQQLSLMLSGTDLNKKRLIYNYSDSYNVILKRLTVTFTYQLKLNQIVSSIYKIGLVPYYKFDNVYYPYFNEGLLFTSTEGLTVRSNSYYEFMYQNAPSLKVKYDVAYMGAEIEQGRKLVNQGKSLLSSVAGSGSAQQVGSNAIAGIGNLFVEFLQSGSEKTFTQTSALAEINASKAGAARTADTYADIGNSLLYDVKIGEYNIYRQKFVIDDKSYQSNCKMLERVGYAVNLYDEINSHNRIGWNYVKLASFDIVENELHFSEKQAKTIRDIFTKGVTLLHDKNLFETGGINKESYDE